MRSSESRCTSPVLSSYIIGNTYTNNLPTLINRVNCYVTILLMLLIEKCNKFDYKLWIIRAEIRGYSLNVFINKPTLWDPNPCEPQKDKKASSASPRKPAKTTLHPWKNQRKKQVQQAYTACVSKIPCIRNITATPSYPGNEASETREEAVK